MVWIRALGPFTAEVDGEPVPLGGPLQRAVLAVLVAARGQVVSADRQTVTLLERLLAEPDLEAAVRCMLLDAYACELAAAGLPAARAAAEEAVALATALDDPALLWRTLSTLSYDLDPALDWRRRQELGERIATADSPGYQRYGLFVQASAAAGAGEPERVKALVAQSLELARKYRMAEPVGVAECALATLLHISGRSDEARCLYAEAAARMAAHGSLHATGYGLLAELSTYADVPAGGVVGEEFMALAAALLDGHGALGADAAAIALTAQGRLEEAREARAKAGPIPPDYFFPVFATFRAMAVIALGEVSAAKEVYEALLPYEDGPPAGTASLSIALRPVAHTLGELARLLGREDAARRHLTRAAAVAFRWGADRWAAESHAAAGRLS
ncbi:hypothetical protein [Streptosporangium sp. NPDC003464]